tara:strand:+ start:448 stop:609 length:162 start_codon:yes stop_codon:yes gene_type:complete
LPHSQTCYEKAGFFRLRIANGIIDSGDKSMVTYAFSDRVGHWGNVASGRVARG